MHIEKICICGAGTMGSGIAQAMAQSGFTTLLYEVNTLTLEKAKASIEKNLQSLVGKNKISTAQKREILDRITFIDDINGCVADVIIEAIIENSAVKVELFHKLAAINQQHTILASNTSSLSVTDIAKHIQHPERFAGLHFFNPATIMKLVEVVRTQYTAESVITNLTELVTKMNKTPVICRDSPGFIVNRVARPFYIESLRLNENAVTDIAQTDRLLEACGFKMGPFRLMDLIGNDVNYAVTCSVYQQLGSPVRLKPSTIQEDCVKQGKLGRKSGAGYYEYEK